MNIESSAPVRIDLAGGTLDIWPLFLLLDRPLTINLGIDLTARASLKIVPSASRPGVVLRSRDLEKEMTLSWKEVCENRVTAPPELAIHLGLLRHFVREQQNSHLTLESHATCPSGAGLGGSSSVNIALVGALDHGLRGGKTPKETLIRIARDVESRILQGPAGMQDYYGAVFGGLQEIAWGAETHSRKALAPAIVSDLSERLILFYSGQSRNSGINNWAVFKGAIEKSEGLRTRLQEISDATQKLSAALEAGDWKSIANAVAEEWRARRELSPTISTPLMEDAFRLAGQKGLHSWKVCGAGGGGCFFLLMPDKNPALRSELVSGVERLGAKELRFRASMSGLEVRST